MRNFEKNIHQKASGFSLEPETDSFDKVMAALEKRKKRRLIIWIWWLIPGLATSAGIITLLVFNSTLFSPVQTSSNPFRYSLPQVNTGWKRSSDVYSNTQTTSLHKNRLQDHVTGSESVNTTQERSYTQQSNTNQNHQVNTESKRSNKEAYVSHLPVNTFQVDDIAITENNEPFLQQRNTTTTIPLFRPSYQKLVSDLAASRRTDFSHMKFTLPGMKEKFSRFSLGAYAELGVMKSVFTNNKDSAGYAYTNQRNSFDTHLFSYSAGLQFRFSPVKFLAIETGIGYSNYQSRQLIETSGSWSITSQGNPDTVVTGIFSLPSPNTKEFYNVYGYISIPLKIYYQKRWNFFGLEAGGGIIFDIPIHTYSYVSDDVGQYSFLKSDVQQSRLNMFGLQVAGNINAVFHVKKFSFFIGPTFKYRVNSMFDNNYIIKQQYYFVGGQTGVRYNF